MSNDGFEDFGSTLVDILEPRRLGFPTPFAEWFQMASFVRYAVGGGIIRRSECIRSSVRHGSLFCTDFAVLQRSTYSVAIPQTRRRVHGRLVRCQFGISTKCIPRTGITFSMDNKYGECQCWSKLVSLARILLPHRYGAPIHCSPLDSPLFSSPRTRWVHHHKFPQLRNATLKNDLTGIPKVWISLHVRKYTRETLFSKCRRQQ